GQQGAGAHKTPHVVRNRYKEGPPCFFAVVRKGRARSCGGGEQKSHRKDAVGEGARELVDLFRFLRRKA
ncbi:MAG: hypothetical protein ACK56I_13275, partial [bacterium]